ncbi:hypothetical protein RBI22_07560 [Alcaligenaceae bacterium C4P045]|nr:hypothetical protein [Alcaligenaceae bacterium C4P045]
MPANAFAHRPLSAAGASCAEPYRPIAMFLPLKAHAAALARRPSHAALPVSTTSQLAAMRRLAA